MPQLSADILREYDESRYTKDKSELCFAPFKNIYFNVNGQGAACWLTFFEAPRYPEHSIHDIWFGNYYKNLRGLIQKKDLSERCKVCERNIANKLFMNPLARAYDTDIAVKPYPSIMEFELSNNCNLECIMCCGRLSSTVRKNRDQLPPQVSPYDSKFIDQLEEFIPHLEEARFNGGEPFLQDLCWQAWDRIVGIKDSVSITIATNGTVWSDRVAKMLERGNFRINLSLDGMTAQTYEKIRVRSNFARVMQNIKHFGDYCQRKGSIFSIMINPMRANWHELPDFVDFCNANNYHMAFNTIYRPFHLALWTLKSDELKGIQRSLSVHKFAQPAQTTNSIFEGNTRKYRNLVNGQILTWAREQEEREKIGTDALNQQNARLGAKKIILERLAIGFSDSKKQEFALEKLSFIEQKVGQNIQEHDFYYHLTQLPHDWLLHDLQNKSVDQMAEEIYQRAEYY